MDSLRMWVNVPTLKHIQVKVQIKTMDFNYEGISNHAVAMHPQSLQTQHGFEDHFSN